MKTSDFYFDLPQELIAQTPLAERTDSRLLVMDRKTGKTEHRIFREVVSYLEPGDCLVLNNTRVLPARIHGQRTSGAKVEFLLLEKTTQEGVWHCLVKPGRKARPGDRFDFGDGLFSGEILSIDEGGMRSVRFDYEGVFENLLDQVGQMPLPPYITTALDEKDRYQTVYAKHNGSSAAPTAGLHFTESLLQELKEKGVEIAYVTLHVGLGTFRPVKVEEIADHEMHAEFYIVDEENAALIRQARQKGRRVVSVGTTSTRTLESVMRDHGDIVATSGWTDIFIYPGYDFRAVDGLITNFHLPESTLIMLVSAFTTREHTLAAYREAVSRRYRFFSFGDAMLIIDREAL